MTARLEPKGIIGELFGDTSSVETRDRKGVDNTGDDKENTKKQLVYENDSGSSRMKHTQEDENIDNHIQQISTTGDLSPRLVDHLKIESKKGRKNSFTGNNKEQTGQGQ